MTPPASPLEGVRVIDLTRLLPGPFCTMLLADFGADVIKIEDTGQGDYGRWAAPGIGSAEPSTDAPFFIGLNRNKRSVSLDLKRADGRDALLRLVASADALLESFRPGVMARLGLGYDVLLGLNPRLVICPITGYGQEGELSARAGHDLNYLARIGLLDLSGEADGPPVQAAAQVADIGGGGLMAAFGVVTALRAAERSGVGQVVDVSMAHGALSWLAGPAAEALGGAPIRRGGFPLGGGVLCYRPYRCADGHVAIGALEPKFWAAFCDGVGRPDLLDRQFDPPGSPAHAELDRLFATRTRAEWAQFGARVDCCLEPVQTLDEALSSPLVRDRGMVAEIAHPGTGGTVSVLGSPIAMSVTPADVHRHPAPALGEHTDEVLRELGYDDGELARLRAARTIGGVARPPASRFLG